MLEEQAFRSGDERIAVQVCGDDLQAKQTVKQLIDLDDFSTYEDALQGVQRLFMVTGYTVDMLNQGKNLTDAAKDAGVEYIVHVGTFDNPALNSLHCRYEWCCSSM